MKKSMLSILVAVMIGFVGSVLAEPAHPVKFPKEYRRWTHVKSMVIFDKKHPLFGAFAGIHHVYANDLAYKAMIKNGDYPKGAVFVFDLLDIKESNGAYVENGRKFIAVMEHDAEKYKDTQGWAWQVFAKGKANELGVPDRAAQKACATCHLEVGAQHFVFTNWRE